MSHAHPSSPPPFLSSTIYTSSITAKGRKASPAISSPPCSSRDSLIIECSWLLPRQLLSASCCKSATLQLVISLTGHLLHLLTPKGKGWVQTALLIPWRTQQWKLSFLHTSRTTKAGGRDPTLRQPAPNSLWKQVTSIFLDSCSNFFIFNPLKTFQQRPNTV